MTDNNPFQRPVSRRTLLQGSAGLAVAAALGGTVPAKAADAKKVIIGAFADGGLTPFKDKIIPLAKSQGFDITFLEDRAIQLVLRGVETGTLATALKGADDAVKEKILKNMSERARENLEEEIDLLGRVRMSLVEESRSHVVQVIRKLEESGEIMISREGEDDYVA